MDNIKACKCVSEFQDKEYGKGMRAHTVGTKAYKCTVCGAVKNKDVKTK